MATIAGRSYTRLASTFTMNTVDWVLRAKVPLFAKFCPLTTPSIDSLAVPPDYSPIFTETLLIPYEVVLRLAASLHLIKSTNGCLLLNTSDYVCPYWHYDSSATMHFKRHQFYLSILLRVNVAYVILSNIFLALLELCHYTNTATLPSEITALLQIYELHANNKTSYKSRQSNKRDRHFASTTQVQVTELAIIFYQLRLFIVAHLPIIEQLKERTAETLEDDLLDIPALSSLYRPSTTYYQLDYPQYASPPPYTLWLPTSEIITPINSPCLLYWELRHTGIRTDGNRTLGITSVSETPQPVAPVEMLLAVMPLRSIIKHIHHLVVENAPIVPEIQAAAYSWYSTKCGISPTTDRNVGSVATAIYYIIHNLEAISANLTAAKTAGTLCRIPSNSTYPPLFARVPDDLLTDTRHFDLLIYAVWLRQLHYLDIVRRFVRTNSLADNIVSHFAIDNHCNLAVSQYTLDVDTSILSTLDPMFAAFLPKTDPVKQLIKGLPQKNLGRALDDAAAVSIQEEQLNLDDPIDDVNAIGNNKKYASYYQWILPILLCTLTGGYIHADSRVSFSQCLAIYQFYTEMSVSNFALAIRALRHPIRFALREYLCHITFGVPDSIQRHGINYSAFYRSTIHICDYMRSIVNRLGQPIVHLPAFLSDAVVSVISSKQVDNEVKQICGLIYRDLRRVIHPLVSYPKTDFATFLFKAIYSIAQEAVVRYMLLYEQLETLHSVIVQCEQLLVRVRGHTDHADDNILRTLAQTDEFATLTFDISDLRNNHAVPISFPDCVHSLDSLRTMESTLLKQLDNGTIVYVLDGPEMAEILHILCKGTETETVARIIAYLSPAAADSLVSVFRKYAFGANEKSVKSLISDSFTPKELAIYFYILYCRRFLCHRIVDAPLSNSASTNLAMALMRIGTTSSDLPDAVFTIYFLPCCNRISTFAKEDTNGNKDVVYNPSSAMFECGAGQSPGFDILIPPLLNEPHYHCILPYFGNISTHKHNNQRKYARTILHHNNKIACDGTPAIPICLRDRQFLFYDNDGGIIVYYFCPICARLTREHILSTHTTLTMCSLCKINSLRIRRWQSCHFCQQAVLNATEVLLAPAPTASSSPYGSTRPNGTREHVSTAYVCQPCMLSHNACTFPLSHPKARPIITNT